MNKMRRFLCICLAFCLTISLLPMQVSAVEKNSAETTGNAVPISTQSFIEATYSSEDDFTNEELFEAYANQLFYGNVSTFRRSAGDLLTGDQKLLYDALVPIIRQIANGERASTSISFGHPVTYGGVLYPVDAELNFSTPGYQVTSGMFNEVIPALLADFPYEMYWYDKVSGCQLLMFPGETLMWVGLDFKVASNYCTSDFYTVDTAKTSAAKTAADNAKAIVAQYAGASDYEKLIGYKNAICQLVEYNYDAAFNGDFRFDNDPWQLIHVFDGDPATNVVCEGYSKAFMYLCDMTDFACDVSCYTVSGGMDGEAHMWNVVEIGGKRYLVDVTNSDADSIGQDGSLFLVGVDGTADSWYLTSDQTLYSYDWETVTMWGTGADSILTLNASNYIPTIQNGTYMDHIYSHGYDYNCDLCGKTRTVDMTRPMVDMFRMYDPNSGEHFYTGSTEERDNLIVAGWKYEGIGFTFPLTTGDPVHRLYDPVYGEHLYTMNVNEMNALLAQGWNYEGIAFNSGFENEVPQYRLHNPNATRGAYHFTASLEERNNLISLGWEDQGIGWYSLGN